MRCPSQLRSTDSSTMRMLTGKREIGPTPASSSFGSEKKLPDLPAPASKLSSVWRGSLGTCRCIVLAVPGPAGPFFRVPALLRARDHREEVRREVCNRQAGRSDLALDLDRHRRAGRDVEGARFGAVRGVEQPAVNLSAGVARR